MTAAILSQIWRYSVYTVRHRAKRLERELRLGNRVGGALPVTSQAPLDLTLPKGREIGSRGFPRRVIMALGRRDEVEASGMLDALVASAARHSRRSTAASSPICGGGCASAPISCSIGCGGRPAAATASTGCWPIGASASMRNARFDICDAG
jgi:hypothetical protein